MENKTHKEIKTLYILVDWFQNFPVIAHTQSQVQYMTKKSGQT